MSAQSLDKTRHDNEEGLFFRRWLAHPLKVGAVLPSSPALAKQVWKQTLVRPDEAVVELGAGTGSVTKVLLKRGVPADRLFVVEIDRDLCAFLRREIAQANVILGDATRLPEILPAKWVGKVSTVISGIPMITLPLAVQQKMIDAWFSVMAPGGRLLQYTYSLISPLPEQKLGLRGTRRGVAVLNLPPAWVWSYEQVGAARDARRAA